MATTYDINSSFNLTTPNGWNKWVYPRTTINASIQLPDALFPPNYTPAKSAWVKGEIGMCDIGWLNPYDYFTIFYLAGGVSGTLMGSLGGIGTADLLANIPDTGTFSAFGPYTGPRFGFSIGNVFKQQSYVRFDIFNVRGVQVVLTNSQLEMVENSKFKRVYINHGEINGYSASGNDFILRLDINKTTPPPSNLQVSNTTIKITQSDGKTFNCNLKSINSSWGFVIDDPGIGNVPKAGDFYELNTVICIEDPYLISGFFEGLENDLFKSSTGAINVDKASGLNLYVTEHNSPFQKSKFTGVYLFQNSDTGVLTSSVVGSNMRDNGGNTWAFYGFQNASLSQTYKNDNRYKEVITPTPDGENSVTTYTLRKTATAQDYSSYIDNNNTSFVRTEIPTGGYYSRQNWQSPCLQNCYIKNNGKFFKILAHVEANVIDVSIKSVDGTTKFDPFSNKDYSIINQSAWIINESYFTDPSSRSGNVFLGTIKSISGTNTLTLNVAQDFEDMGKSKYGTTLSQRYKTEITLPSTYKKAYSKNQDWLLVSGGKGYRISSLSFSDPKATKNYTIKLNMLDDVSHVSLNTSSFITFDVPYHSTSGSYSGIAETSLILSANGALNNKTLFCVSDTLCLNGECVAPPYSLEIPVDTRIGVGDCQYFGVDANNSALNRDGTLMFATTLENAQAIACLFHYLREEDWVFYKDVITGKITIRRGCLNFKELPQKSEVSIGMAAATENVNGSIIKLNTNYERLKRIILPVQAGSGTDISYVFYLGANSKANTYGFLVYGQGKVDLEYLRRNGITEGQTPSNQWTYQNYDVSPVYVYKKNWYQNLDYLMVDMGVPTVNTSSIYIDPPDISGATTQYVNENQTLGVGGFFDVHRLLDNEILLLYSATTQNFICNGKTYKDWSGSQNSVMMIDTSDDDFKWAAPFANATNQTDSKYQFPLAVLNSCDYMTSIYNPMRQSLSIFARCYTSNTSTYIGCMNIFVQNLIHQTFLCTDVSYNASSPSKTPLPFIYRPPIMEDSVILDPSKSWTSPNNIIKTPYSYDPKSSLSKDVFIRVMGDASKTKSLINTTSVPNIISANILSDGTYMLLYNSPSGVMAAFSSDGGITWGSPNIIYVRDASSAILLGEFVYYVSSSGIMIKRTDIQDFYNGNLIVNQKIAGIDTSSLEVTVQNKLDHEGIFSTGSGSLNSQRLSGYISDDGIIKIFYYAISGVLSCVESPDSYIWTIADNF